MPELGVEGVKIPPTEICVVLAFGGVVRLLPSRGLSDGLCIGLLLIFVVSLCE